MLKIGLEQIMDADRRRLVTCILELLRNFLGDNLISVVVFGSVARGRADPDSDTDVILVASNMPRSLSERMEVLANLLVEFSKTQICEELNRKGLNTWVQFHPLTMEEAELHRPIYLDVVEDGVIIYDKGDFMKRVIEGFRSKLEALGAKRIFLEDGSWYWDLKPSIKRGEVVEV